MNDPKMPYFEGLIFADDGFKRDFAELIFADARNLVKSKFGKPNLVPGYIYKL